MILADVFRLKIKATDTVFVFLHQGMDYAEKRKAD